MNAIDSRRLEHDVARKPLRIPDQSGTGIFGIMLYSVFERSGFRFASGKRVNAKRVNAKTWSIFAIQANAKIL
jgi:hypothetical protein